MGSSASVLTSSSRGHHAAASARCAGTADRRKIKKVDGPGRQYLDLFVKMIDWLEVQEAAARQLDEVRKAGPGPGALLQGLKGDY
jgi:hypothetical protein